MKSILLIVLITCQLNSIIIAQNPIELGRVNWLRDLDVGIAQAEKQKKLVLILFQEVPGCATCRNYGKQVLSHPIIVDAIEELFIPVAIFNNKKGKDDQTLTFFHEPAWNNPVVRIVDKHKRDVIDRVAGNYSKWHVVSAMVQALEKNDKTIPEYLRLFEKELLAEGETETVYFSMYCFWTGEKELGKLDGVVETESGFMDGKEVVRIDYDPLIIQLDALINRAKKSSSVQFVYVTSSEQKNRVAKEIGFDRIKKIKDFTADNDPKYYLSRTHYRFIPMTAMQATRVNSCLGQNKSPDKFLSPSQLRLLEYFRENGEVDHINMINQNIQEAWSNIEIILEK